ncbi:MAG: RNA polymerase sigma factor [Chitinophagaceae bacterium]
MIKGCISQKVQCQKALFNTYAPKFMTVCLRYAVDTMEAEDFLQEGFVRIFNNLHQFKFEGSFEGWMRRIVVNVCLKKLQKKKIIFNEISEEYATMPIIDANAYAHLGENDLLKLINNLPEGYRIVFNLNVIEGYSHEEIAKMLNVQPSTSRSQLVKARKMLQQQILELQKVAV